MEDHTLVRTTVKGVDMRRAGNMICNHCKSEIDWHPLLSALVMRRIMVVNQKDVILETCCPGYANEVNDSLDMLDEVGNERN